MGRPPGRVQAITFQMRATAEFLKSVDKWRAKQEDKPSRAEAIRRLVELGLKAEMNAPVNDDKSPLIDLIRSYATKQ